MISLNNGETEKSYVFIGFSEANNYEKHLSNLGFVKGRELQIVSSNGEQGLIVQIQDSRIAITAELSKQILLEEKSLEKNQQYVSLASLPISHKGVVMGILGAGSVKRRLMDMGITRGVEVLMRKRAPLGDPLEINIRGYELTLRNAEAELVLVHEIEE